MIVGAALLLTVAVVPALSVTAGQLTGAADDLLSPAELPDELPLPDERSVVLAADGSLIGHFIGAENRVLVGLDDIADHLEHAVIATEDAGFRSHIGVDHGAVVRALVENVRSGQVQQGGSTITQQYVKNALLSSEQTIGRKLKEIATAVDLERRLDKDEILERYLNLAYFGNGNYGAEAAAQFYFEESAADLEIHEAAMLAGLIRLPEDNEPLDNPRAAQQRRDIVIGQMAINNYLTDAEAEAAMARPLDVVGERPPPPRFPFVVEYVKQVLLADPALGETRADRARILFGGGLEIRTTLDPRLQEAADSVIEQFLDDPVADPLGALVTLEPGTGRLLAMGYGPKGFGECPAGQRDCGTTKVNPVVPEAGGSGRQLGSAFKPILDVAALDRGIDEATTLPAFTGSTVEEEQCETDGEKWEPANYNLGGPRWVDMVEAIRTSNNVYHAHLITEVGIEPTVRMARTLGISTPLPPVCSLALGTAEVFPIDVAEVYATFAARGTHCEAFVIDQVRSPGGQTLVENQPVCDRVLDEDVADTMNTMLEHNARSGTGTRANLPRPNAGKTGTTQGFADAWYAGYVPQLATIAWLGHESPRCSGDDTVGCGPMTGILGQRRVSGGSVPAMMWHAYMTAAVGGLEVEPIVTVDLQRARRGPEDLRQPSESESPPPAPPPPSPEPPPPPSPEPPPPPSPEPSPSPTPTGGTEEESSASPSPSPSEDPSPSPSPSEDPSPSPSQDLSPSPSQDLSPSPSQDLSPSPSPSPS